MRAEIPGDGPILYHPPASPDPVAPVVPRSHGAAFLSVKARGRKSALERFRTSGSLKLLFPRGVDRLDGILVNTSGGVTSGDRMQIEGEVGEDASLALTTQAAERAYRADQGEARVRALFRVARGGALYWMPQELILFNGASLDRRLRIDLAAGARLLMVEPLIFGRAAMGESVTRLAFRDRIEITRDGQPLYTDAIGFRGDMDAHLMRRGVAGGARAMASLVHVAPDAEAHLEPLRAMLPQGAGVSLLAADMLALRLVAEDGFALRAALLPVLDRLSHNTLPVSWRL